MSLSEARDNLANVIGQVQFGGERIVLEKRGKPVAVVVSVADADWLERMEDHADLMAFREAKEEMARMGGKTYTLDEVLAETDDDQDA